MNHRGPVARLFFKFPQSRRSMSDKKRPASSGAFP
jgi:hypothetical protein